MLQGKHSALLSTFIKLQFVLKMIVLSFLEWPFYTGFTVINSQDSVIIKHYFYTVYIEENRVDSDQLALADLDLH